MWIPNNISWDYWIFRIHHYSCWFRFGGLLKSIVYILLWMHGQDGATLKVQYEGRMPDLNVRADSISHI